jgi:hypothetical protein
MARQKEYPPYKKEYPPYKKEYPFTKEGASAGVPKGISTKGISWKGIP